MNKAELSEQIAQKVGLSKKQVEEVLDAFESVTIETLKSNGEVTLTGFGTFSARIREARGGVNPQNPSERIQIPTVTVPKFKAGKNLKDSLKHANAQPEKLDDPVINPGSEQNDPTLPEPETQGSTTPPAA